MHQGKRKKQKMGYSRKKWNCFTLSWPTYGLEWNFKNIPGDGMLQRWIEQYRKFGTCVDNRGKATHLDNPSKGRPRNSKTTYKDMSKEELIKELEFRDELKNFLVYLNQQNKDI